jgi:hypothetical protein
LSIRKNAVLAVASIALAAVMASAPTPSAFVAPLSGQLFVSPETTVTAEFSLIVLSVDVSADVTGLMGYNVGVTFDHSLIDLQAAEEGSLPTTSSDTTFFYYWYDPMVTGLDSVHVNGAVLGRTIDGPGSLFTLEFQVHEVTQPETTEVLITYSELRNGVNQSITHTTKGGVVIIEPTIAVKRTTWGALKARYE